MADESELRRGPFENDVDKVKVKNMSRRKRRASFKEPKSDETKSRGLCQKCDNMDPKAFKYELFCAMRKFLDPETKTIKVKPVRLYARITCRVCSEFKATVDRKILEEVIGLS